MEKQNKVVAGYLLWPIPNMVCPVYLEPHVDVAT